MLIYLFTSVNGRMKEFVEQIQIYLHSYVQRRDGIKQIEVSFLQNEFMVSAVVE